MEIGELIAIILAFLGLDDPPGPPDFVADVTEMTVSDCLPACRDQSSIPTPHWKKDDDASLADDWKADAARLGVAAGPYSKRAAVLLINTKAKLKLKVKVLKSKGVSGDVKVVGTIGDLTFSGTSPSGVGEHSIDVTLDTAPADMRAYRGRIRWVLETTTPPRRVSGSGSLVELYFVLAKPRQMFDGHGVWIELLRLLFGRIGVARTADAATVFARVASYTFSDHGLKYDTFRGAPSYYKGTSFRLGDYLRRTSERCNCYDQASAVQVFAGAVGCAADWLYMDPFGYINTTNLIGVGRCNSPFFGADVARQVVSRSDKHRTSFGNHAFAGPTSSNVVDSCAGPHRGDESRKEYVGASIDADLALYSGGDRPGTEADIVAEAGILSVS